MKKSIASLSAVICMAAALFPSGASLTASAAEYSGDNYTITYSTSGNEAAITDFSGSASALIIPETINGYSVTSISSEAFADLDSITDVTIPDSVTSIGSKAFWNCSSLKTVAIGSGTAQIGDYAFSACPRLSSFSVSSANSSYCAVGGMLLSDDGTELVAYAGSSDAAVPEGVKTIGKGAFFGNTALGSVKLPSGLTSIGDYAFSGCFSLESAAIPLTVKTLGKGAFLNCSVLTEVTIGAGVTEIPDECFSLCASLEAVTISSSVTKIGSEAFFSCPLLEGIYIPGSVKSIGTDAIGSHYSIRGGVNIIYENFYISGDNGSAAQKYAASNGLYFIDYADPPYGDVNADGAVNALDASEVLTEYASIAIGNQPSFNYYQTFAADYNCDGNTDALDASLILTEYANNATGQK